MLSDVIVMTLGYEGLDVGRFVAELNANRVATLVDVRELPLSRKKGFSKSALAARVQSAGIAYVHMPSLGCPREIRRDYYEDRDWGRYKKRFTAYLHTQREALEVLRESVVQASSCLVCFEANYEFCHRSLITSALARDRRLKIRHLRVRHPTTSAGSELVFA